MIHAILLAFGLASPSFKVGDSICMSFRYESREWTFLEQVEKVGKSNYLLGDGHPDHPKFFHREDSIVFTDYEYHLCTDEDKAQAQ